MKKVTPEDVRRFIQTYLTEKAGEGQDIPDRLADDFDLFLSGLIDSLGFLELAMALGEHFGREMDFEDLPAEDMTVVGPLCRYVSNQLNDSGRSAP